MRLKAQNEFLPRLTALLYHHAGFYVAIYVFYVLLWFIFVKLTPFSKIYKATLEN